jgi:hypothetical protein
MAMKVHSLFSQGLHGREAPEAVRSIGNPTSKQKSLDDRRAAGQTEWFIGRLEAVTRQMLIEGRAAFAAPPDRLIIPSVMSHHFTFEKGLSQLPAESAQEPVSSGPTG